MKKRGETKDLLPRKEWEPWNSHRPAQHVYRAFWGTILFLVDTACVVSSPIYQCGCTSSRSILAYIPHEFMI